jgi:ribosomal protein S18 acetylase RimI-like enzyme
MKIRNINNESDLDKIVDIHIKAFSGFFLTKMGKSFLKAYYNVVISYTGGILLAYDNDDGITTGFVSGFFEPKQFYSYMSTCKKRFIAPILLAIIKNPALIPDVYKNIRKVESFDIKEYLPANNGVELSSIAVNPDYSGGGVGKLLVDSFCDHVKEKDINYIYLTTDAKNNERVNKFYQKYGFVLTKTFFNHAKREMNLYVLELNK